MSNSKQTTQQKIKSQDPISELNSVLSVRAEQIRKRLLDERNHFDDSSYAGEENNEDKKESTILASLSQARLRRRQKARSGSDIRNMPRSQNTGASKLQHETYTKHVKGNSTVNIKNYRPGYTWSMGGRVKELRIRCIARKFLYKWQRKTFGRVPLSVAQHHYETVLLHKAFGMWHDFWWEIVKEWRLTVRAECHFRYKLGLSMFLQWKKFVIWKQIQKAKIASVQNHYDLHLTSTVWKTWKNVIAHRKHQLLMKKRADELFHHCIVRKSWALWMQKVYKVKSRKESHTMAMQFWAYRIQAQHWLIWMSALKERQLQQQRCSDATVYYNSVLVSKCLKAWNLHVWNRKAKKSQAEFAQGVYCLSLKLRCLNHWHQHWHLKHSLQQHHLKIQTLSLTFKTQWALWRWKQYVMMCKEKKSQESMVDEYYNFKLKRTGLDAFRLNSVHSHIKVMRNRLVDQLRTTQLQRLAWNNWISTLDHRDELKQAPQTKLACEHYNCKILHKCFSSLVSNAQWRRHRKKQYAEADAYLYLHTMPLCLFHMRMFVEQEKTCRANAALALEFRRVNLLDQIFHTWHNVMLQSRDERMMNRMALLHREAVITQSAFSLWRQRVKEAQVLEEKMTQAEYHYLWTLCSKAWSAWRLHVTQKNKCVVNYQKAVCHHYLKTLKTSFCHWKKWLQEKKIIMSKRKKADTYHKSKILRICVREWKNVVAQARVFKAKADVRFNEFSVRLQRVVFLEWRTAARYLAAERRRKMTASAHYQRGLIQKVFKEWHTYTVVQAYKHSQACELVKEAAKQLQQLKLSLYMKRWKGEKDAALKSHQYLTKADAHYKHHLEKIALEGWKSYCRLCIKKRLLARQCQWFYDVRVTAKHFLIWKGWLVQYREQNNRTQLALWQWSLVLQRKVLLAWKSFVDIRKHKKARLVKASEMYRQRLIKEACYQWLSTADSSSHMRYLIAAKHQTEAAFDRFHLLQRCVLHWKAWARRRAAAKVSAAKSRMALTLTSNTRLTPNLSALPLTSHIYPSLPKDVPPPRPAPDEPIKAFNTPERLKHQQNLARYVSLPDRCVQPRPPPKRPAFLMDSLKRAGLYSALNDNLGEVSHESGDTGDIDNTHFLGDSQHDAAAGRSEHRDCTSFPSHQAKMTPGQDGLLSATVMGGSKSELEARKVDIVHGGVYTSSFSGISLPHHAALSGISAAAETWQDCISKVGSGPESKEESQVEESRGIKVEPVKLGLNVTGIDLLNAEICNEYGSACVLVSQSTRNINEWPQQHIDNKEQPQKQPSHVVRQEEPFVLLKPSDFMKKPVKQSVTVRSSRKTENKHIHQTCATQKIDHTSGLSIVPSSLSRNVESSSNSNPNKDNLIPLQCIPSAIPQGTFDTEIGDSNTDESANNSATSQGMIFANLESPTPEEEIINIRDRLKLFNQQKKKLKALSKQYRQLSEWIKEQTVLGYAGGADYQNATEELEILKLEVAELQTVVDSQGLICERLVLRAQTLAKELHIPF